MKVSIFKDGSILYGVDYSYTPPQEEIPETKDEEGNITQEFMPAVQESGNPECIACIDVNFDPATETLEIIEKKGKFSANIITLPTPPETLEEQKSRIIASIISAEDLSTMDLEGVAFSDIEAGDIIVRKVFGGNPYAQTSLLRKVAKIQEARLSGMEITPEMQATLDYANTIDQKIEALLTFFYQ